MPDWTDVSSWHHPEYRIMAAMGAGLKTIERGMVVDWQNRGQEVRLIGPTPAVIRLNDTPIRMQNANLFAEAERIVTIAPLTDNTVARFVERDDRAFEYVVSCGIQLTRSEQEQDQDELGTDSLLARKIDAWLHDFRAIFNSNMELAYDGCDVGLVDEHSYSIQHDPQIDYPKAIVLISCRCLPTA